MFKHCCENKQTTYVSSSVGGFYIGSSRYKESVEFMTLHNLLHGLLFLPTFLKSPLFLLVWQVVVDTEQVDILILIMLFYYFSHLPQAGRGRDLFLFRDLPKYHPYNRIPKYLPYNRIPKYHPYNRILVITLRAQIQLVWGWLLRQGEWTFCKSVMSFAYFYHSIISWKIRECPHALPNNR